MERPLADRRCSRSNAAAAVVYDFDMDKIMFVRNVVKATHDFACARITDHPRRNIDRQIPDGKSSAGANRKRVDVSGAHSGFTLFIL